MRRTKAQVKVAKALTAEPDGRHYGYPLSRAAGVRSGVLYPMLSRFEAAGLIVGEWDDPDPDHPSRPRRRHYTITPVGRTTLADLAEGKDAWPSN
jgi:PadR family transcriptional regulator PadR